MNQLIALLLAIAPVPSPSAPKTSQQIVDAELPSLLAIYTDLHAHPELSGHEAKTSAVVARELRAAGCEVTENVGKYENPALTGYGVVGLLKNGPGPTVLIRSDLDGLPVTEETGLPFASKDTATDDDGQTVGVMHACGHDIHMSSLIGAARVLSRLKDQWSGTIVFVGQPAEETGIGARALLKDGLYTRWPKPDFVLGLHDSAQIAVGRIGVTEGYAYANVDSVDVTVRGVGGHGAYPHKTKDPIVLAAEMILEWQTIASRENNPLDPVVVTVGSIHGGSKHNVIPDEVKLQLTVRSYKADVRERVLAAIDRIAQGCAVAAGFPPDRMPVVTVRRDEFTPATYNNPELTRRVFSVLQGALGQDRIEKSDPTMGGEDFSEYSLLPEHSIPACMFNVGAVDPERLAASQAPGGTPLPSLHSSRFAPVAEPTIRTGIVGMTSVVLELMKR